MGEATHSFGMKDNGWWEMAAPFPLGSKDVSLARTNTWAELSIRLSSQHPPRQTWSGAGPATQPQGHGQRLPVCGLPAPGACHLGSMAIPPAPHGLTLALPALPISQDVLSPPVPIPPSGCTHMMYPVMSAGGRRVMHVVSSENILLSAATPLLAPHPNAHTPRGCLVPVPPGTASSPP